VCAAERRSAEQPGQWPVLDGQPLQPEEHDGDRQAHGRTDVADEAKARAAYATKVEGYKLCKAMDKAAANHFKTTAGAGKQPSAGAPACTDPGPFAYTPPKPAEAAGAHSPAATATSPPSNQAPAGAPTPKKP